LKTSESEIHNPCMHALHIIADIKYDSGKNVKYKREAHREKRGINEKQPDLGDRNIEFFAKVSANPKGMSFKKGNYFL